MAIHNEIEFERDICHHLAGCQPRRDGNVLSTAGRSTITGVPGAVQPLSQQRPGWRLAVMGRVSSWGAAAALPSRRRAG